MAPVPPLGTSLRMNLFTVPALRLAAAAAGDQRRNTGRPRSPANHTTCCIRHSAGKLLCETDMQIFDGCVTLARDSHMHS